MSKITYPYSNIIDAIWILKDILERLEEEDCNVYDTISAYELKKAIAILEEEELQNG